MHTQEVERLIDGCVVMDPLTLREREILQSVADGLSNAEIAEQFFLSITTVKWHLRNIYARLGVHNRTAAVVQARTR